MQVGRSGKFRVAFCLSGHKSLEYVFESYVGLISQIDFPHEAAGQSVDLNISVKHLGFEAAGMKIKFTGPGTRDIRGDENLRMWTMFPEIS